MKAELQIAVNLGVVLALRKIPERIGISEQNLSRLKTGKTKQIGFSTLAKICDALECQSGDILEAKSRSEWDHRLLKIVPFQTPLSHHVQNVPGQVLHRPSKTDIGFGHVAICIILQNKYNVESSVAPLLWLPPLMQDVSDLLE